MSRFYDRRSKSLTVVQLEEAISKTISELLGKTYTVEIKKVDFHPSSYTNPQLVDAFQFDVTAATPLDLPFGEPKEPK